MTAVNNIKMTYGSSIVTIGVTRPERTFGNLVSSITLPKIGTTGESGTTKILNLRRIEKRFNVDGYLASGLGTTDTHWDALNKELDLISMFNVGQAITMTWLDGTTTYSVTMEKLSTERLLNDGESSCDGEAEYVIKFTAIYGEDLLTP